MKYAISAAIIVAAGVFSYMSWSRDPTLGIVVSYLMLVFVMIAVSAVMMFEIPSKEPERSIFDDFIDDTVARCQVYLDCLEELSDGLGEIVESYEKSRDSHQELLDDEERPANEDTT